MISTYGNPPPPDQCREVGSEGIILVANQTFLSPVVSTAMVPHALGRPLPPAAIARQLRLRYEGKPVMLVTDKQTFYVSKEGWCVT